MDKFTAKARSQIMAAVKNKDSKAELAVRSKLHKMGYRFKLHDQTLIGKPDIVLPKYKTIIFVHGCFWHRHSCKRATSPASNKKYWKEKFEKNVTRFKKVKKTLKADGWNIKIVWECETNNNFLLEKKLKKMFIYAENIN